MKGYECTYDCSYGHFDHRDGYLYRGNFDFDASE